MQQVRPVQDQPVGPGGNGVDHLERGIAIGAIARRRWRVAFARGVIPGQARGIQCLEAGGTVAEKAVPSSLSGDRKWTVANCSRSAVSTCGTR